MIEEPQVVHHPPESIAFIHFMVPRDRIRVVMEPGYRELIDTLSSVGTSPAGPWFTHHLRMSPAVFDFELGVPVASPIAPSGRVPPGTLRETRLVRTVYHGPYEGLGSAWGELDTWISVSGLTPAEDLWEVYIVGPESSDDPSQWRTQLNRPLA